MQDVAAAARQRPHGPGAVEPLTVVEGIPEGWERSLAGAPITASSPWIELAAARIPGGYRTFMLPDRGAVKIAFGGGIMTSATGHPRFDPYEVLSGRSAHHDIAQAGPHPWRDRAAEDVFPCCLLMLPNYETAPVGTARSDPRAHREFLRSLEAWCEAEGVRSIAALFLRPEPEEAHEALAEAGFQIVPMADRAELAVEWPDFDGYLAWLPKRRRASVRGELRALAERGVEIVERPLREEEPELVRLRGKLIEKYGGHPDAEREARGFAALHTAFGTENLSVFEAVLDGVTLGFALFVRDGTHWTGLMTGTDYADPQSALTYFATFFYRPAAAAPGHGIDRVSYGIGSLKAKRLRGCTPRTLYAACRILGEEKASV